MNENERKKARIEINFYDFFYGVAKKEKRCTIQMDFFMDVDVSNGVAELHIIFIQYIVHLIR